jgi:uncharacterized protein DUF3826
MKKIILATALAFISATVFAAETNSDASAEIKYTAAIEGRTADILKVLNLSDTNVAAKVHDIIIAQYRALNAWHEENDPKLKAAKADTNAIAQIRASLQSLHDGFLSQLAENLTPGQVEKVKDKLTYGKVQFTFAGYLAEYPNLSVENKAEILQLLKQAREEAMDGGSAAQKTAVFTKYKGKINNYLSKQGLHPAKPKAASATNSVGQ